ncbi:MAG: AsmA-like C-terminal region-containing protein [Imperialibacter sp.]|uniref:AsmA-like C-terminal region-containing protein n=1 Tax=Imperialibacter sp. TaxID=2038411 RepID=UPI003A851F2A
MKIPRLAALILTGVIAFVTATLLACLLYIQINRDEFIQYFLDNVNERLTTPVKVGHIDISYWDSFPNISIVLQKVEAGTPEDPLVSIGRLSFSFHLWNFLDKNYHIRQLNVEKAEINLLIDENGIRNFDVFKKKVVDEESPKLTIGKLRISNSKIRYEDRPSELLSYWEFSQAHFDIQSINSPQVFSGHWKGTNLKTVYQGFPYMEGRLLEIELLGMRIDKGHLTEIKAWELKEASHNLTGTLTSSSPDELLLEWSGNTKSLKDLLSNIPAGWPTDWASYDLEGEATFKGSYVKQNGKPTLVTDFSGQHVRFLYPSRQLTFSDFSLDGRLTTNLQSEGTSLQLQNLSGTMNAFPVQGDATITNMATMHTRAELEGNMTLAQFEKIVPDWGIKSESGTLTYLLGFEGKLDEKATGDWLIDGETTIQDATFSWQSYPLLFREWSGILLFNDRDVAFTETTGKLGNSDLRINGLLRNFHFFYEEKNNLLLVEGKVSANRLDLNELLANKNTSNGDGGAYSLTVSPRLRVKLTAEAETVVFDRFTGKNVNAEVLIQNRQVYVKKLDFSTMGGDIKLTGNLSDQPGDTLLTYFSGEVKNLYIDSVFYVFHDFGQTWMQSKHIKGQLFADFDVDMGVHNNLSFMSDLFRARINARGVNGQLIDFAPMQELSRLVKEDKLGHLTFGELTNQFLIENRKILIPSMDIKSNVSNITLSGTHTFDQQIDYRLKVPLFNKQRRRDNDESFGAIEEDERGNIYAHVKIAGTTDDYKVSYDARSAAKSLIENIKEEGKVLLQEIRKEPGKNAKTLQLKEEEFFEFEADTTKKGN